MLMPHCFEEADVFQTVDGSLISSFSTVREWVGVWLWLVVGIKQRVPVLIPAWIKSWSLMSLPRPRPVE